MLASIRKEEARKTEKKLRLKKTVRSNCVSAESPEVDKDNEIERLRKRVEQLEAVSVLGQRVQEPERRRKRFCYRCGIDGHLAYRCTRPPNEELVQKKLKELRNDQGNCSRLPQQADVGNKK